MRPARLGRAWARRTASVLVAGVLAAAVLTGISLPPAGAATPGPATSPWVKDTTHDLDIFLPDANSDYYLGGFGTDHGARTVVTGSVPTARYWSFTAYPLPVGSAGGEIHDTQITRGHGRYRVTIAATCRGVRGACLATRGVGGTNGVAGFLVFRLYVPKDLGGPGTGGVPLPTVSYVNRHGGTISLARAAGTSAVGAALASYRNRHGALPATLTRRYPPAAPVPAPVAGPPPHGIVAHHSGRFNNPNNTYEHVRFTTARGNLVVSARAPTYQTDSFTPVNDLARRPSQSPQVRYWSLCIVLKDLHTGDCLRDERVHFPANSRRFTAIVSPTCPVAGYRNCLTAGPQPLQVSLAYRYLLPSPSFRRLAFRGPYGITATYVARPG